MDLSDISTHLHIIISIIIIKRSRFLNKSNGDEVMFKQVTLYTHVLKRMRRFYQNVMQLDIIDDHDQQLSVIGGETTLSFIQSEHEVAYHFAIDMRRRHFSI